MSICSDEGAKFFNSVNEVNTHIEPLRSRGKTLVTTNGCFDILHEGHVRYLYQASRFGDLLVVGINSDAVARKLKGANRPVQTESERGLIISALEVVDAVFIFNEDDPRAFIEVLKPDVHVKGGDYSPDILEKPTVEKYGGHVEIASFVPRRSTSQIIRKINERA